MNWQPALDALWDALTHTFATPGIEAVAIQERFVSIASQITRQGGSDTATHGWQATFQLLRDCLERTLPTISSHHPEAHYEIYGSFELLVRELRKSAHESAGDRWPLIRIAWRKASVLAEQMANEGQVQLGSPSPQNIFYFSTADSRDYVRHLHQMWSAERRSDPDSVRLLKRVIFEEGFGVRLQSVLNAPEGRRPLLCQRLCKRAKLNQDGTVPTLTAGLTCLLNPSHAQELVAALKNDPRAQKDGIPETLALWLGDETVEFFEHLITQAQDPRAKDRWVVALGGVGGCKATRVLCGLLWDPSVREKVLDVIAQLASTATAAVYLPGELPDSYIEDTVKLLLDNLAQLEHLDGVNQQRISEVKERIRAYHEPRDDASLKETVRFLKEAGADVELAAAQSLTILSVQGVLEPYAPMPVRIATGQVAESDIWHLVANSRRGFELVSAGILVYQEAPDASSRLAIAQARLNHGIAVIPIPLADIERVAEISGAKGEFAAAAKLKEYAGRYLPHADMFDDRNAISDTLTFFGRSGVLNLIQKELLRVQSIGLFGLRKSGKTSMLLQLELSLKRHASVLVDLQKYQGRARYGGQLFEEILLNLASKPAIAKSVPARILASFPKNVPAGELGPEFSSRFSELVQMLARAEYQMPVVCALDEVERILPSPGHSRESVEEFNSFFGALRALSQQSRTVVLIATDVHPDFNRTNQWPQEGTAANPVYNFFKEIYLAPFDEESTKNLIDGIGSLMGLQFEEDVMKSIHKASGGHPYISRQLASLVSKTGNEDPGPIQLSAASRYLDDPFIYSGLLKNYFDENVWGDLMKRKFDSAMAVLRVLTASLHDGEGITWQSLEQRFGSSFGKNQLLEALVWLVDVGLVHRRWQGKQEAYEMRVPLLSRWIEMA